MVHFSASGPVVCMRCCLGTPECNSTSNPCAELPIACTNKITPHLHRDYDMIPKLFAAIQPHMAVDCGLHTKDGIQIPSAMSIGTKQNIAMYFYSFHRVCSSTPSISFAALFLHNATRGVPNGLLKRSFFVTVRNSSISTAMTKNVRASYILGITFIAAVEKKKWGHQNCWGYHIAALSNDVTIIERLSKTPTVEANDLASRPTAGAGASSNCPGTNEKRKVPSGARRKRKTARSDPHSVPAPTLLEKNPKKRKPTTTTPTTNRTPAFPPATKETTKKTKT
ncbi:unnamed protein product [Ectocarpus sp. CCAP 1310/34]|nr:unnamed protein product [Ectocarpus sp. CCAP 1310/34]